MVVSGIIVTKKLRFEHFYRKGNQAKSNKEKPKPMFTIEPLKQCTQKNTTQLHTTHTNGNCLREITRSILFIFGYSIQHRAVSFRTAFVVYWDILANCKSIDERLINCWFFFFFYFFLFFPFFTLSKVMHSLLFHEVDFVQIQFQCVCLYIAWLITMPNVVFLFDFLSLVSIIFSPVNCKHLVHLLRTFFHDMLFRFNVYDDGFFLCSNNSFYRADGFVVGAPHFYIWTAFTFVI